MITELEIGGVSVDVIRKDIKNLHLSVYPPTGRVRIAAPSRISLKAIRAFAITRLTWIRRHQRKVIMQEREPPREYIDRESHYVWGERVMLKVVERELSPTVSLKHRTLTMQVRLNADATSREQLLAGWYRDQLRERAISSLDRWQAHLGVTASTLFVRRMKTKWGSCNPHTGNIRLNTELAKKPAECLDYVILHDLAHLRVRLHTSEFFGLLDSAMPHWKMVRHLLNNLPLRQNEC